MNGDPAWWDEFFADRARPIPFFAEWPDENLAEWCETGLTKPARVLELGCGPGRNAIYLAGLGASVDAVDFSAEAIGWARERAETAGADVRFQRCSIFDADIAPGAYDLVYDSGCLHHIRPRERNDYVALVTRALRPGGSYGLVCFTPEGGSGLTDQQAEEQDSVGGGLGFSHDQLLAQWDRAPFAVRVLRQMMQCPEGERRFGLNFLWTLLAVKEASA